MFRFSCKECGAEIQINDLAPEIINCKECKESIEVPLNYRKSNYAAGIISFCIGIILAILCLASGSTDDGILWFAVTAACVCFFGGYISLLVTSGAAKISNTIKRLAK